MANHQPSDELDSSDELDDSLSKVDAGLKEISNEMEEHELGDCDPSGIPAKRRRLKRQGHLDDEDRELLNKERGYSVEILIHQNAFYFRIRSKYKYKGP